MKKATILKIVPLFLIQLFMVSPSFSQLITKDEVSNASVELRELVDRVNDVYRPIFRKNLLRFKIRADFDEELAMDINDRITHWGSPASADFFPNRLGVVDFRGETMALDYMTKDVGALILCHEIGHLIGGAPLNKKLSFEGKWTTSEGQADYFSTLKCVKRLWQLDEAQVLERDLDIPGSLWNKCDLQFAELKDRGICQRTLKAINNLAKTYFYSRSTSEEAIGLNVNSAYIADVTIEKYPDDQCRIDILVAGALCNKKGKLSKLDPTLGVCAEENGDIQGVRPRCWYKPLSLQELGALKDKNMLEKFRSLIRD